MTIPNNLAEQWSINGYAIVRNVFDSEHVTQLRAICDRILEHWRVNNPETGEPGGGADAHVMRHLNHVGYYPDRPAELPILLDAVADQRVLDTMRTIFGEEPLFRCTSYFFNPLVTTQDGNWHRDSQFSAPDDETEQTVIAQAAGNSVQLQIPLVPSDDIEVVPGSHLRWDSRDEYSIRKADGGANNRANNMPGAVRVELDAGDALLFNPMGLHRGRYHANKLRRTLMLTYTKTSAPRFDYFSNQPWCLTSGYLAQVQPKTRDFLTRFIQTYQEKWLI